MPPRLAPWVAAWLVGLPFLGASDLGLADSPHFLASHPWLLAGAIFPALAAIFSRRLPQLSLIDLPLLALAAWCVGRGLVTSDRHAGLAAGLAWGAMVASPLALGWWRENPVGRVWLWRLLAVQGCVALAEWGVCRTLSRESPSGIPLILLLGSLAMGVGWKWGWPLMLAGAALSMSIAQPTFSIEPWYGFLPACGILGAGPGQERDFWVQHGVPSDSAAPGWFQLMLSLGWIGAVLAAATVAVWLYSGRAAEVQEATAADGAVPPPVWLAWAVQGGLVAVLLARLAVADSDHRIGELAMGAARSLAGALGLAIGRVGCPGPWMGRFSILFASAITLLIPSMAHAGAISMLLLAGAALPARPAQQRNKPLELAGLMAVLALLAGAVLGGVGVCMSGMTGWALSAEANRRRDIPGIMDGKTLDIKRPILLDPLRRAARMDPEQSLWRLQLAERANTLFALGLDWQRSSWLDDVRKEGLRHALEVQRLRPNGAMGYQAEVNLRLTTARWLASRRFIDQALAQFDAAARKAEILAQLDPAGHVAPGLYLAFRARLEAFDAMGTEVADLRRIQVEQQRLKAAAAAALASAPRLTPTQRMEIEAWCEPVPSP